MTTDDASADAARRVLAREVAYDDVDAAAQRLVRDAWDEEVQRRLTRLDLAAEFSRRGRSWSECDQAGNIVSRR